MTEQPDFEALRAERNAKRRAWEAKMVAEGWQAAHHCALSREDACYCACPDGPCEHTWDGEPYQSDKLSSAICSRCGALAFSHGMRVMP